MRDPLCVNRLGERALDDPEPPAGRASRDVRVPLLPSHPSTLAALLLCPLRPRASSGRPSSRTREPNTMPARAALSESRPYGQPERGAARRSAALLTGRISSLTGRISFPCRSAPSPTRLSTFRCRSAVSPCRLAASPCRGAPSPHRSALFPRGEATIPRREASRPAGEEPRSSISRSGEAGNRREQRSAGRSAGR